MTLNDKTTLINPAEQAGLFKALQSTFRVDVAPMPFLTPSPGPATIASAQLPSAADLVSDIARRQHLRRAMIADQTTRTLASKLSIRELAQIHYVPFAIAEVIWDSVDSLIELSKGLPELKQLARTARVARQRYLKSFPRNLRGSFDGGEMRANGEAFEEHISRHWATMTTALRAEIKTQFPDLEDYQGVDILQGAWQIKILMMALEQFIKKTLRKIEKLTPFELSPSDILPKPYWNLRLIISAYCSPMTPEKTRFKADQWAAVISTQIALIEV